MDYLEKSKKAFTNALKKNENITREAWDEYASENQLYTAFTLETHLLNEHEYASDESKFELLKDKLMPFRKWWR